MKRAVSALLFAIALALALWACDPLNLPTPVPAPASLTPTQDSPEASTPTVTPARLTPTSTLVPLTAVPTEAQATPTSVLASITEEPTTTANPLSTDTATPQNERQTTPPPPEDSATPSTPRPTSSAHRPTHTPTEPAPTNGWTEVSRVPPGKKQIALTFDAGASGETWPTILGALREHNVHITMFFTGKFAEQYPDAIRQAVADGHEVANHTYSHPDTRTITDAQLIDELSHTENIIQGLTGITTKPYWRPPYGARNNHVLNLAAAQGYRTIMWTLDSLDSVGQPKTPDFIFNRVTNTPGVNLDGAIVLQHFGSEASAEALPRELTKLEEMGLQVVTISQLLSP